MNIRVTWVEIPVADLDRAAAFYSALLNEEIQQRVDGPRKVAVFPHEGGKTGMSLTQVAGFHPGENGPLAYIMTGEDVNILLERIEAAGGKTVIPKTERPNEGFFATFLDSEGNTLALFSQI